MTKKIRIEGSFELYRSSTKTLDLYFRTTIFDNVDDPDFIVKLLDLGFTDIVRKRNYKMDVRLPCRWAHVHIDNEHAIIIDDQGRTRMTVNKDMKTTIIHPRYKYQVIKLSSLDMIAQIVNIELLDQEERIESYNISTKEYNLLIEAADGNEDYAQHLLEGEAVKLLSNLFPHWDNELAYW